MTTDTFGVVVVGERRCSRMVVELSRVPRRDAMPAVRTVPLSNFR